MLRSRLSITGLALLALTACSAEAGLKEELQEANHCETADDCVLIGSKCPFDCYVYVHKDEAGEMKEKLDAYQSTCQYSCIASSGVECKESKCVVITDMPVR